MTSLRNDHERMQSWGSFIKEKICNVFLDRNYQYCRLVYNSMIKMTMDP